jgi:hypothetical protein
VCACTLFFFFLIFIIIPCMRECVRVNSGGTGSLGDLYNKETIGQHVKKASVAETSTREFI